MQKRKRWIFLTLLPAEREALRPLQSLWIDWLVLRLLNELTAAQKCVWFVIDELASLQKLPQLHTAITEARKSNNLVVLGFQGKAQLEYLYGHLAEVMLSQPATSVWLTTKEPNAGFVLPPAQHAAHARISPPGTSLRCPINHPLKAMAHETKIRHYFYSAAKRRSRGVLWSIFAPTLAVRGFAPTSRVARQLNDAGVISETLQKFLASPLDRN